MRIIYLNLLLLLGLSLFSQKYYPKERSLTLDTFINTGFIGSFDSGSSGGSLNSGLILNGLYKKMSLKGVVGVKYLNDSGNSTVLRSGVGTGLSFDRRYINLTPTLSTLINSDFNNLGYEVSLSLDVSAHLYNRELLTISPVVSYSDSLGFTYGAQIGLRRSEAIFLPVHPVNPWIEIDEVLFSPDNDGINDLLHIRLKGENLDSLTKWRLILFDSRGYSIKSWDGGKRYPVEIIWNGKIRENEIIPAASDFHLKLLSWDYLDRLTVTNRAFKSDILVVKDGERYRINIPSIIFPPNGNDFSTLSDEQIRSNEEIISSVSRKLNKFPDYRIVVEGHGNIINWGSEESKERENRDILIPLTNSRAEFVMNMLVEYGIDSDRVTAQGVGGLNPIVPFGDIQRWKNRRVELILLK